MQSDETSDGRGGVDRGWVEALLDALREPLGGASSTAVIPTGDCHNHDLIEVRLDDGRALMIKRASHDWAGPRFAASRIASVMLRREAGIIAPIHIEPPDGFGGRPLEIYWKVPLPTLEDLWSEIPADGRPRVLRDWGALARRVHAVRLARFGPLPDGVDGTGGLRDFLRRDLAGRLLPAVRAIWPAGRRSVERLVRAVDPIAPRVADRGARLVHNDLHMGNVLCERRAGRIRCVGLIDLEAAAGAPPEADLASTAVLHGPGFGHRLRGNWFRHLREGYDGVLEADVLLFFRGYHLVNMGFYSALVDRHEHADEVARMARTAVERLDARALAGA